MKSSQYCVVALLVFVLLAALCPSVPAQEENGEHILFQAIRRGDEALMKNILRRGAPPDLRDEDGAAPLMQAALHGSAEMVELLLDYGADPKAETRRGVSALLWGARDERKAKLLLDAGADVNAKSRLGNTPLMVAAAAPDGAPAVKLLLENGADVAARNNSGRTALRNAAGAGNVESVRLLLAKARDEGRLKEVVDRAGPVVAIAAGQGFAHIVDILLAHGADPNRTNGSRGHGLNAALLSEQTDIAKTLIAHGAALDRSIRPGDTPTAVLAAYTELGDTEIIELLAEKGVDFAAAHDDEQTALTWARMRGHENLIDFLTKAGAPAGKLPATPEIPARSIRLDGENDAELIARAVQKSVDLLQLSSDTFLDVRSNCVSCHHQNLPGVAIGWARDRGFEVRQQSLDRMNERQVKSWQPRLERAYQLDSPFPVPPRFLGYGMWSFAELGYRPDELTRTVSWYLTATQQPDGRWTPGMMRPPLGGDEILATMLAMRSLQLYPPAGREAEIAERVDRAKQWLWQAQPRTRQQRVYHMLALAWAGVETEKLQSQTDALLAAQRDDGGWAQLPGLPSDAWATGQTLVALHAAGGLPVDDPAYRRGVEFLLSTQFDDGSWFVQSRSWPFQPYFESKFPYGRDQWISAPATAWAVMALSLAIDPQDVARIDAASNYHPDVEQPSKAAAECNREKPTLVAAAKRKVDFAKDIKPLLARSCIGCHGEKEPQSNFSLTSRAALLRGGDSELPAITPGASADSPLLRFAAGLVQDMEMPPLDAREKYPPLTPEQIALLRAWIDQGADWPQPEK